MPLTQRPPLTFEYFPARPSFDLVSDDIEDGVEMNRDQVANVMGYDGGNLSPHLRWSGCPENTRSFAITIHDPDAPTGSGFWHWSVCNVPASCRELPSGAGNAEALELPPGAVTLRNDAGTYGYVGAAPPVGDGPHRYVVTVHALDVDTLDIDETASPAVLGFMTHFHAAARAQIVPQFTPSES